MNCYTYFDYQKSIFFTTSSTSTLINSLFFDNRENFIPYKTKENICEVLIQTKPKLSYSLRQAQVIIRLDHTTAVIRPQAFGRLRPGFRYY